MSWLWVWGVQAALATPGVQGQNPTTCWYIFLAPPDNIYCKPLRALKIIRELPFLFPHLLGAHIPSPGHVKAAGIWLAGPHVFVPAVSRGSVPGHGRPPSARLQPRGCKTRPGLGKQGSGAMSDSCPLPCGVTEHGDLGTPARPPRTPSLPLVSRRLGGG